MVMVSCALKPVCDARARRGSEKTDVESLADVFIEALILASWHI